MRSKLGERGEKISATHADGQQSARSSNAIPINTPESKIFHWTWSQCTSSYIPFIFFFSFANLFSFSNKYTKIKIYAPFCDATTTAPNEANASRELCKHKQEKRNVQVRSVFRVFCRALELSKRWNMHFSVCVSGVPLPMRVILHYVFILARRWHASIYFHSIC